MKISLISLVVFPRRCCVMFLLLWTVPAHSQEIDTSAFYHTVRLQFGVNQIKEQNLHNKVSTGTITDMAYGFEKRDRHLQQFCLSLGYSRLKTGLEDLSKTINIKMDLDYSFDFLLVRKRNFRYYLGPEAGIAYSLSFYPNWDDSHLYWADYYSVGINNSIMVQSRKGHQWITSLSLPFFSVFSRPEPYRLYKIDDTSFGGIVGNMNSNLTPAHLKNVFYVKLRTEYRFEAFKNKQEAFTFSAAYCGVKHDNGQKYSQLSYLIGIKFLL